MTRSDARSSSIAEAGRATIFLTGGAVIVQLIGFVRQMFLAAEVGIDSDLDALFIGLAMPMALVGVLTGGITVALVPSYVQAREEHGPEAARRLAGTLLVWVGLAGTALSVALWVWADAIVALTAPGLDEAGAASAAVGYLRALAPLTLVSSVSAVVYAACQAERMFRPMVVTSVAGPSLALAILIHFWPALELQGFVIGTLVGEIVGLSILVAAMMSRRVAPLPHLVSRGLGIRALVRHAAPLTLSRALVQVRGVFDRAIASLLLAGGVSALRYGDSLVRLPFAAITPAYNTAIYPTLVNASRSPASAGLGATTERLLRYGLVFFVPLAGLTIAVAPLAVGLVYDRGSFSDTDLMLTAQLTAVSAPLIVTWTVQPTLVSALNARRKGAILLAGGVITMVGNVVLDVVLGLLLGVVGIPLATVVVSVFVLVFMANRLVRLEPALSLGMVWGTFLKAALATLPGALVLGIPVWGGWMGEDAGQRIFGLVVVGVAGLTSYYGIARRLGLAEADSIIAFGLDTMRQLSARVLGPVRRVRR